MDVAVTRTLDLTPYEGEMLKPAELVGLHGIGSLTLQDRKVYNILVDHAWGPHLGVPGHWFEIPTSKLRNATDRNSRLGPTITRLMQTVCRKIGKDGEEIRVQLLGTTVIRSSANNGVLRYKIPEELSLLLNRSKIFAKLDIEVLGGFSSKYAVSLYEVISQKINLHYATQDLTENELREILGVEVGKLTTAFNLKKRAIEPALSELNSITPYDVTILPRKDGRKIVGYIMGWNVKSEASQKAAFSELHRHRVGRKARLMGDVDNILDKKTA